MLVVLVALLFFLVVVSAWTARQKQVEGASDLKRWAWIGMAATVAECIFAVDLLHLHFASLILFFGTLFFAGFTTARFLGSTFQTKQKKDMALAYLLVFGLLAGLAWRRDLAHLSYLARHYNTYSHQLQKLSRMPMVQKSYFHEKFLLDQGPPLRVAFPLPGLSRKSWTGIVHDSSGLLLTLPSPNAARIFNGRAIACEGLWGPWRLCEFY